MNASLNRPPVGVFDSGIGGLSVLRLLRTELPGFPLIYVADQAHVPYGPRPLEEVRSFSESITRFLFDQGARLIVVACNAASAAALNYLRSSFPAISFVGMEPAVKPAAEYSANRVVAVLATPATFQGALYASVVERFANGVRLLQHTCPGLVDQIERGDLQSRRTRRILTQALEPMLAQGADTVVLGCTHYPFVIPIIEQIAGPGVRVIDPAPAVARQARRVLEASAAPPPCEQRFPAERYFTSGDPQKFAKALHDLLGVAAPVEGLRWQGLVLSQIENTTRK